MATMMSAIYNELQQATQRTTRENAEILGDGVADAAHAMLSKIEETFPILSQVFKEDAQSLMAKMNAIIATDDKEVEDHEAHAKDLSEKITDFVYSLNDNVKGMLGDFSERMPREQYQRDLEKHIVESLGEGEKTQIARNLLYSFMSELSYQCASWWLVEGGGQEQIKKAFHPSIAGAVAGSFAFLLSELKKSRNRGRSEVIASVILGKVTIEKSREILTDDQRMLLSNLKFLSPDQRLSKYAEGVMGKQHIYKMLRGDIEPKTKTAVSSVATAFAVAELLMKPGGDKLLLISLGLGLLFTPFTSSIVDNGIDNSQKMEKAKAEVVKETIEMLNAITVTATDGDVDANTDTILSKVEEIFHRLQGVSLSREQATILNIAASGLATALAAAVSKGNPFSRTAAAMSTIITNTPYYIRNILVDKRAMEMYKDFNFVQQQIAEVAEFEERKQQDGLKYEQGDENTFILNNVTAYGGTPTPRRADQSVTQFITAVKDDGAQELLNTDYASQRKEQGNPTQGTALFQTVELDLSNHKRIAISGRSGSGKSCLLYMILKTFMPAEGTITLPFDPDELAERVVYLPQQNTFPSGITLGQYFGIYSRNLDADGNPIEVLDANNRLFNKRLCNFFGIEYQEGRPFDQTVLAMRNGIHGEEFQRLFPTTPGFNALGSNFRELFLKLIINQCDLQEKITVNDILNSTDTNWLNNLNLSGGQKSRLPIMKGLFKDCKVVLLDEPYNQLDDATKEQIMHLQDRCYGKEVWIMYVDHHIDPNIGFEGTASLILNKADHSLTISEGLGAVTVIQAAELAAKRAALQGLTLEIQEIERAQNIRNPHDYSHLEPHQINGFFEYYSGKLKDPLISNTELFTIVLSPHFLGLLQQGGFYQQVAQDEDLVRALFNNSALNECLDHYDMLFDNNAEAFRDSDSHQEEISELDSMIKRDKYSSGQIGVQGMLNFLTKFKDLKATFIGLEAAAQPIAQDEVVEQREPWYSKLGVNLDFEGYELPSWEGVKERLPDATWVRDAATAKLQQVQQALTGMLPGHA